MVGMILDGVLMLLLALALAYGVRLERKLTALRAGQLAFASAVTELNTAAGRAESALASLRASGQETDLLHDRIIKAREVKAQLEALIARAPESRAVASVVTPPVAPRPAPVLAAVAAHDNDDRARRMAALAERIQGMAAPTRQPSGEIAAILGALTANQSGKQSLNRARRSLDEDLFAA